MIFFRNKKSFKRDLKDFPEGNRQLCCQTIISYGFIIILFFQDC